MILHGSTFEAHGISRSDSRYTRDAALIRMPVWRAAPGRWRRDPLVPPGAAEILALMIAVRLGNAAELGIFLAGVLGFKLVGDAVHGSIDLSLE